MKFKKIFICLSLGCLSLQTYAQSTETKSDTTTKVDNSKKLNVSFKMYSELSLGSLQLKNSLVNSGLDLSGNILFLTNKPKKHVVQFGVGFDYQFYALNTNNLLYANKDSLWYNNTGSQLKSNSLNLYYLTLPIIYRNRVSPKFRFEVGLMNKFLFLQENLYRQNTPYNTVMTENMYQNTKFNKYQADVFVRVHLYKILFIEARQSLTQVSGYSNFNSRPYSFSVGLKFL